MGEKRTISPEQAFDELQGILALAQIDDLAFARGNYCLRVLGCPVSVNGKPAVIEDQPGPEARTLWDQYEFERDALKERHADWLEIYRDSE